MIACGIVIPICTNDVQLLKECFVQKLRFKRFAIGEMTLKVTRLIGIGAIQ